MSTIFAITTMYGHGLDLLPHWCQHYTALGADCLLLVIGFRHDQDFLRGTDHASNPFPHVVDIAKQFPAKVFPFAFDKYHTMYTQYVREHVKRAAGVGPDDWVMHADLDEFYEFPIRLRELVAVMEVANDWALHGHILDRVAQDGSLPSVLNGKNIGEQFPLGCHLTGRIFGANTRKIMLCRGRVRVNAAHDNTFNGRWKRIPVGTVDQYIAHHFRWTDALIPKLKARLAGQGIGETYRNEIRRFLAYWEKHGRIDISDPRIEAHFVGRLTPEKGNAIHNVDNRPDTCQLLERDITSGTPHP